MLLLVVDGYRKKVVVEIFDADVCIVVRLIGLIGLPSDEGLNLI